MRHDTLRRRAIWLGIAGLIVLLAVANLALSPESRSGAAFVPGCTGCHDGLLVPVR